MGLGAGKYSMRSSGGEAGQSLTRIVKAFILRAYRIFQFAGGVFGLISKDFFARRRVRTSLQGVAWRGAGFWSSRLLFISGRTCTLGGSGNRNGAKTLRTTVSIKVPGFISASNTSTSLRDHGSHRLTTLPVGRRGYACRRLCVRPGAQPDVNSSGAAQLDSRRKPEREAEPIERRHSSERGRSGH